MNCFQAEIYKRLGFKIMHEGICMADPGMKKDDYTEAVKGMLWRWVAIFRFDP